MLIVYLLINRWIDRETINLINEWCELEDNKEKSIPARLNNHIAYITKEKKW